MGNEASSPNRLHHSNGTASDGSVSSSASTAPTSHSSSTAASSNIGQKIHDKPGAYKMPGKPSNQRYYVVVPAGVRPGQHFAVVVNGQQMMVRCPEGHRPGDRLTLSAPRQQPQQYIVTVPANVKPNQQFKVLINQREVMVTCPRDVRPGQRVTFTLPPLDTSQNSSPNQQMFEVQVPDGVEPGRPFAIIANGQRVLVTCPPNVKPGQKLRFQLPITLSQQQLEAIKVDYDMDGWMRCLGSDLKFHWAYNKSKLVSHNSKSVDDNIAFVRILDPPVSELEYKPSSPIEGKVVLIPAEDFAIETTVKGTSVSYQEINNVARRPLSEKVDWLKNQFASLRVNWEEGHMKIRVRRQHLLSDAMDAFASIAPADMHKIFRYEFIGEPALDAGGVTREFFSEISSQLCNPDRGLFLYSSANQMCVHFNANSGLANDTHLQYFHMLGRLLGKSLMDNQITPVHFVLPIYKHLMGWPISLRDLEHLDADLYRSYSDLVNMEDVSVLYFDFTVTEEHLGTNETVELKENGDKIMLDSNNLLEFLNLQVQYRLCRRIEAQLNAFLRGFYDVVPEPFLSVFNFQELELLLHGLPNIDMNDWINNTEYTGAFHEKGAKHPVVIWFWEIVNDFSHENRAKLLQFVTGTAGVPAQGFSCLQGNDGNIRKFTLHGDQNLEIFPRAHTCFNRMDVPIYKKKADIAKYLPMAITFEASGFDIE